MRFPIQAIAALGIFLSAAALPAQKAEPRFTEDNQLLRPEGFREWIFVGASLAMSYDKEPSEAKHPTFHNIYINPRSYRAYKKTGRFPERTILAMEVFRSGSHASINRRGRFEERSVGLEAAVKDSSRFAESWAYFSFDLPEGKRADRAKAFPKDRCWTCHDEHAATDNVFTQFYPVLRKAERGPIRRGE